MPPELIPNLYDFGALGLFAAFLIWQYVMMQRRLDKRDAAQAEETEKREDEAKIREEKAKNETKEQAERFQGLLDSFADALKTIEAAHEARVEIMRERYDVTIEKVRIEGAERLAECLKLRDALARDALAAKTAGAD